MKRIADGEQDSKANTQRKPTTDRYRGVAVSCPLAALARLQLGRAYGLQGDSVRSRATYEDFFTPWKEADPDIPMLIKAIKHRNGAGVPGSVTTKRELVAAVVARRSSRLSELDICRPSY